jgi:hypothetical protein
MQLQYISRQGSTRGGSQQQQQQHIHPMIIQSRSTDSQLDVESYHSQKMKQSIRMVSATTDTIATNTPSFSSLQSSKSGKDITSFFRRTNPSFNDSSESSTSSLMSKENWNDYTSFTKPTKRIRRSQDIFRSVTATTTITTGTPEVEQEMNKRSKFGTIYDTHKNDLWIQRSYAFDEDEESDDDEINNDDCVVEPP